MRARKSFQAEVLRCVGIDEAGLGPILGPFCAAAVHLDGLDHTANLPRTWRRAFEAPTPALQVADSKLVFRGPHGRARGEASALAALLHSRSLGQAAANGAGFAAEGVFETAGLVRDACAHAAPWYGGMAEALPRWTNSAAVAAACRELSSTPRSARVRWHRTAMRWVPENEFNRALERWQNKADATWEIVGSLLREALEDPVPQSFAIRIDRQGGRRFYADRLQELLPTWELVAAREERACSTYELCERASGRQAEVMLEPRAEQNSFAVAMASIVAKYFRELAMDAFNRWFAIKVPSVRATAGYPEDGQRWLEEMKPHLDLLKISAESLRRQR